MQPITGDHEGDSRDSTHRVEGSASATRASQPTASETTAWQDPVGRQLGDFLIVRELGRGAMGVVYLAEQVSLKRLVALKVLLHQSNTSPRYLQRFEREAAAAARLMHDGIVHIIQYGCEAEMHYIAMEYIEGCSLERALRPESKGEDQAEERLPAGLAQLSGTGHPETVARFVASIAEALHHAHERGVLHRDIKPQNILIDRDCRPHLVDFGLAKVLDEASISRSGDISGTPYYMSPEQALAKRVKIDHRTDVFSLGVVLYEMLSRHRPFEGDTFHEVLYGISFRDPQPLRRLDPRTPQPLALLCAKALEKSPEHRFQDARALAVELRRFSNGEEITTRAPSVAERMRRAAVLHRGAVVTGVLVLVALVTGMLIGFGGSPERPRPGDMLVRHAHTLAGLIDTMNLGLFNGQDRDTDRDRRSSLSGDLREAASEIGEGDVEIADGLLTGVVRRMDGLGEDDWMHSSPEREAYRLLITELIAELRK